MRAYYRIRSALLLAVALAAPAPLFGDTPTLPEGKDWSKPVAIAKPKIVGKWRAVICREDCPVYKAAEGDEKLAGDAPKFGDLYYVAHEQKSPGKPHRFLVGDFGGDGSTFAKWVGWIDECYVLDSPLPVHVK